MIAPRFWSGNARCRPQFQCDDVVFGQCRNVPASAGIGRKFLRARAGGRLSGRLQWLELHFIDWRLCVPGLFIAA